MAEQITFQFTRRQLRNYAVVDREKFDLQAYTRRIALAAAAMVQWVDHARANFSRATSDRYISALFWEPENPSFVRMGILPGSFGAALEEGSHAFDLKPGFLKSKSTPRPRGKDKAQRKRGASKGPPPKGGRSRVIPIDHMRDAKLADPPPPLLASIEGIKSLVAHRIDRVAVGVIKNQLSYFNKASASARNVTEKPRMLPSSSAVFRTVSTNSPADTWKHPGMRAAHINSIVSSWMDLNRESFTSDMFQGDPGIVG